jgi:hypothetical protein
MPLDHETLRELKYGQKAPKNTRALLHFLHDRFGLDAELRGTEVGVEQGVTSEQLLRLFPNLVLWMVDSWNGPDCRPRRFRVRKPIPTGRVCLLEAIDRIAPYGRGLIVRHASPRATPLVPDELDFVYVDGDHSYDAVAADLRAWWPKIRPGGVLCGDDYGGMGDKSSVFGVQQAVDEFAAQLEIAVGKGWWHLYYLEKI